MTLWLQISFINFILVPTIVFGAQGPSKPSKPAPPTILKDGKASELEVVKGKALIHRLALNDYMKNLEPDQVMEKMDSRGKKDADIFIIYQKSDDGSKRLVMQLFDLNRDGKIDLAKHFEKGKLVKTEADLDFDGFVDVVSEYDPATGELKKKTQADGDTNIWKYYVKNELRRKEIDRNSDGKPDMWVYFRNNKILKTEIDEKFDGKSIRRIEGPLDPAKGKKMASAAKANKPSAKATSDSDED
jgi:hypothetical protein